MLGRVADPRASLAAAGVAVALAVLLALPPIPRPIGPASAGPMSGVAPATVRPASCTGTPTAAQHDGRLVNEGGPSPGPPVSGQTIVFDYLYLETFRPNNGSAVLSCLGGSSWATTNSSGGFQATAVLPTSTCNAHVGCWNYSGPFAPIRFTLSNNSTLAGDYLSFAISSGFVTVARVAAFDRLVLAPGGVATVSVLAPSWIRASALAGDGRPSPATLTYAWNVSSSAWLILGPTNGSALEVEAPGAVPIATASVRVNGTYNGSATSPATVQVILTAAATAITTASVLPNAVDLGSPAAFTVAGTGAAGYAYTATVRPGLGASDVTAACGATPVSGGLVDLSCRALVFYERTGAAQPTANLSNGYSTAAWTFPTVSVSAILGVRVTPSPVVGYPGDLVTITGAVAPATGTPPYGPACLSSGDGREQCSFAPGPSWTFQYAYAVAGPYQALLSIADSGGRNLTTIVPVAIAQRPAVQPIAVASNAVVVGGPISATAVLSGGAMPVAYWWNLSAPASTVAGGTRSADGLLSLWTYAPQSGPTSLTLTIVDALGTRVSVRADLLVGDDGAASIVVVGPPNVTASAGVPIAFAFEARDALGGLAQGYSGPVALAIAGASGASVWVNTSVLGPVSRSSDGTYRPDPSAWRSGFLNLTVAESLSGTISVSLASAAGLAGPPAITVAIGPDIRHLALWEPEFVHRGSRSNATLYGITDRFGNPIPSGFIVVRSVFGPVVTMIDSPIRVVGLESVVWVNFSASGSGAGTVYVIDSNGNALLAPIEVPSPPPDAGSPTLLLAASAVVAALAAVGVVALRRRRTAVLEAPDTEGSAEIEDQLKRLAEGRAHVLARTPTDRSVDLDEIADGWTGRPPDPSELAEWVGSLVAEGTLHASVGPDGRPRFVRVEPTAPEPPPRVELDTTALEEALARREQDEPADGRAAPPTDAERPEGDAPAD